MCCWVARTCEEYLLRRFWLNLVGSTTSASPHAHSDHTNKSPTQLSAVKKNLKHINLPRGTKHKAFPSLLRRGHQYFTALGEHASLADCVLIEKERATLIVLGHSFEVGLLLFKCLSSACLSPSASKVSAASQWEQKHLAGYLKRALLCGISWMKRHLLPFFYYERRARLL